MFFFLGQIHKFEKKKSLELAAFFIEFEPEKQFKTKVWLLGIANLEEKMYNLLYIEIYKYLFCMQHRNESSLFELLDDP